MKKFYTVTVIIHSPMLTPMLMLDSHLRLQVVIITQILILEPDFGSPLSSLSCTEGQCRIAGWQHMVLVWFTTSLFHSWAFVLTSR